MAPKRYRKKPVVIEVVQWTGDNFPELEDFAGAHFQLVHPDERTEDPDITAEVFDDLHSTWVGVKTGQHVIKGIKGEFYPIDPDVLQATYDPIITLSTDQACKALDKAAAQVEAVRALHAPEIHYHRANPYGWTANCDHCDNPVRDSAWDLTAQHFSDEHGELRCRIRPRRTCTHCVTTWGDEASWPCETAELVQETDDAHS